MADDGKEKRCALWKLRED